MSRIRKSFVTIAGPRVESSDIMMGAFLHLLPTQTYGSNLNGESFLAAAI